MNKKTLYIISGCSGVGKNSVYAIASSKKDWSYQEIVSTTSRGIREGEIDGKEYNFISKEEFEEKIKTGEIFEWTITHGNYYGTSRNELKKVLDSDKSPVCIIDVKGLVSMKKLFGEEFEINSIFILPPSFETLEKRIRMRRSESEESIMRRLDTAREELKHVEEYDYHVINDELEECAKQVYDIMMRK